MDYLDVTTAADVIEAGHDVVDDAVVGCSDADTQPTSAVGLQFHFDVASAVGEAPAEYELPALVQWHLVAQISNTILCIRTSQRQHHRNRYYPISSLKTRHFVLTLKPNKWTFHGVGDRYFEAL